MHHKKWVVDVTSPPTARPRRPERTPWLWRPSQSQAKHRLLWCRTYPLRVCLRSQPQTHSRAAHRIEPNTECQAACRVKLRMYNTQPAGSTIICLKVVLHIIFRHIFESYSFFNFFYRTIDSMYLTWQYVLHARPAGAPVAR